jgi:hypothetical protein
VVVDQVYSSGLWPLDEMRRSTLVVSMCDVMEETFHCDIREVRRPKPCAEDLEVQVVHVERHHLDMTTHTLDLYI